MLKKGWTIDMKVLQKKEWEPGKRFQKWDRIVKPSQRNMFSEIKLAIKCNTKSHTVSNGVMVSLRIFIGKK